MSLLLGYEQCYLYRLPIILNILLVSLSVARIFYILFREITFVNCFKRISIQDGCQFFWFRGYLCSKLFRSFGKGTWVDRLCNFGPGRGVSIGTNSNIGKRAWLLGDITIGDDVVMAPEVIAISSNHDFSDTTVPIRLQGQTKSEPIVIGNDVWLGARCILLPGVTVNPLDIASSLMV